MISNGFSYDDNVGFVKTEKFGVEWDSKVNYDRTDSFSFYLLKNNEFGEFVISQKALDSINEVDYYKVLSLIYEQRNNKNIYSVTLVEERDKLQWSYDNYISLSIGEFFGRFPSDFIAIQHRALLNLYSQCSEYGQTIKQLPYYMFFAKNGSESLFCIESMEKNGWIDSDIMKSDGRPTLLNSILITDEGWMEIETTIKKNRKKQVFIAMKFKDMDNIHNTIRRAIIEASFFPFRIDEKEHINQITSEIQYEITQSGLVVADVTGQNQGVYFEAGYAMGLNIPVIWTCDDKEKDKIHFDIKQYNTILWKDEEELYEKLKKRIIAIMGLRGDE